MEKSLDGFRLWLEAGRIIVNGIEFVLPLRARKDTLVMADVAKIESSISKDHNFYVGPGGRGAAIGGRYEGFQEFLKKGTPIEVPEMGVWHGDAFFTNGRHRFAVLRDMGFDRIPVAVARGQAATFKRRFGADQS